MVAPIYIAWSSIVYLSDERRRDDGAKITGDLLPSSRPQARVPSRSARTIGRLVSARKYLSLIDKRVDLGRVRRRVIGQSRGRDPDCRNRRNGVIACEFIRCEAHSFEFQLAGTRRATTAIKQGSCAFTLLRPKSSVRFCRSDPNGKLDLMFLIGKEARLSDIGAILIHSCVLL